MTKTVFVFAILIAFVVITVWFVVQKTKEVGEVPTLSPTESEEQSRGSSISQPNQDDLGEIGTSGPTRYDNGLIVQDLVVGNGKVAENGDTLDAHYVGTLEDGTKFDSSYDRGQPLQFVLGAGQLIKGWELGLVGMKEGGKRKLIIPPELGYGSRGIPNMISPNATLIFEIELVEVTKK